MVNKKMKNIINIFEMPKLPLYEELITSLAQSQNVRIERIVSTGHTSSWYNQAETEFVVLLEGHAEIEFDGKPPVKLCRGDALKIAPHERHRVSYTSSEPPCVWLCVFY